MAAKIGVVVFPGSNCEHDVVKALGLFGSSRVDAGLVWHGERSLAGYDAIVLPGGFAHGDYLRPGALARFSPVMEALSKYAADGGPVVGICNGFQVLTEAGLLPGALQKNRGLRFLCTTVGVEVCTTRTVLTGESELGAQLSLPINHFEGNFTCDLRHPRAAARRGPHRPALHRQPQRLARRHRRRVQRGGQRGGPHAASRARL